MSEEQGAKGDAYLEFSKPSDKLFVTPWTVAYEAPLSMGVSRQEY